MEALVIAVLALVTLTSSFHIPLSGSSSIRRRTNHQPSTAGAPVTIASPVPVLSPRQHHQRRSQFARSDGGDNPGMEDAFRELEALQSLDDDGVPNLPKRKPKEKDEAFAKAMDGLDLKDILSEVDEGNGSDVVVSPESEVELYKDMASELSAASSKPDLIAADLQSDLEMAGGDEKPTLDTEKFMNKAIEEALKEAKEQNNDVGKTIGDKKALLDNKEIMKEIEKIFDKANDELLEGLEEIRAEQISLARENAERNAKASQEKIKEDEQRMEVAQGNMKKMINKVNEETRNVEKAMEALKLAQEESEAGIDGQLSNLKSGGLIKQATLAGAILFTFRSGAETIGFLAGDPSHALPALIQGALAIICVLGFIFL